VPRNPSLSQIEASRRNLRGKAGPKTEGGKRTSAANGRKNQGTKTAKARARIINARHGINTESFYAYADCLNCTKHCAWPTFSPTTAFRDLPLGCLEEVLVSRPDRCFYHLEGLCLADFRKLASTHPGRLCVIEPRFIHTFEVSDHNVNDESLNRAELEFRRKIIRLVTEARAYIQRLRREELTEVEIHPRMMSVLRLLRKALNNCAPCQYTPWRDYDDWDRWLRWIADGEFEKSKRSSGRVSP